MSIVAFLAAGTMLAGCDVLPSVGPAEDEADASSTSGAAEPRQTLRAPADPASLTLEDANYVGWALLDRRTGQIVGSPNAESESNTVESMIKPWLAADYLRQASETGEAPDETTLDELTLMIVDSNDPMAESYYQLGGADGVIERLNELCGLDVWIEPDLWGMTEMTPADAVRYGRCVADGTAAGPRWTPWLLDTMKQIRGGVDDQESGEVQGGRWGIIDGLPDSLARDVSFKNGWTEYEDGWHVNCLAIHPDWILAVMMRMPDTLSVAAAGCASIAAALVVDAPRS